MAAPHQHLLIDHLVVPVSGHLGDGVALAHAVALAAPAGLPITVLRQVSSGMATSAPREETELLASRYTDAELYVHIVPAERPVEAIVDALEKRPGALVCMSTRAPDVGGQLLFGSVAIEVARRSPAPLILLGPHAVLPEEAPAVRDIVACVDGTERAERAVVVSESVGDALGLPVETCQVPAPPAEGLVALAGERPTAMLALATHARRIGERFRAGSVTVDVVGAVAGPVLVVGPSCRTTLPEAATIR